MIQNCWKNNVNYCSLEQIVIILNRNDWNSFGKIQHISSSGKGGQRKNRVKTAVRLTCPITKEQVSFGNHRETNRNMQQAIFLLRMKIALKYYILDFQNKTEKPAFRYPISPKHFEFPLIVFRCLVVLMVFLGSLSKSAIFLKTTTSKLVRFFYIESKVICEVQKIRSSYNLVNLKSP